MQNWIPIVRQLCDCFGENEKRLEFLHEIDRKILNQEVSIEEILDFILNQITFFIKEIDLAAILIKCGDKLDLLCRSEISLEKLYSTSINYEFVKDILDKPFIVQNRDKEDEGSIIRLLTNGRTGIVFPIVLKNNLWGIICFESILPDVASPFYDDNTSNFLKIIARQMSIAIQSRSQHNQLLQFTNIHKLFFEKELNLSDSLKELITNIISILPSVGSLKIEPPPGIQILFYEKGQDYLTIKATSGNEKMNTRVYIKKSICGMVVENPQMAFYICDPREFKDRYKSYLGKDSEGNLLSEISTELVVPIKWNNELIGVINFESEKEKAFKEEHIQAINELVESVSPIINALKSRIESSQQNRQASLYALNKFLNRISDTYSHKMGTPLSNVALRLGLMKEKIKRTGKIDESFLPEITEDMQMVINAVTDIDNYHLTFAKDLSGYLTYGRYSINMIIHGAVNDTRPNTLCERYSISYDVNLQLDYDVFCSLFFREHIYNILNNAIQSLNQKIEATNEFKGKISIKTELHQDDEEQQLNKQCIITIRDNGNGVTAELLKEVCKPSFTTKTTGKGFGLYAASEYLKSLGGNLTVDSKFGQFFEVKMYLDLFNTDIHDRQNVFSAITTREE